MIGSFFGALWVPLSIVFDAVMIVLVVNALLSWIHPKPDNPAVQVLERISDFVCNPIRKLFPTIVSGFDLAPMIALLVLMFLKEFLRRLLGGL